VTGIAQTSSAETKSRFASAPSALKATIDKSLKRNRPQLCEQSSELSTIPMENLVSGSITGFHLVFEEVTHTKTKKASLAMLKKTL
jgi:hypothetical protein